MTDAAMAADSGDSIPADRTKKEATRSRDDDSSQEKIGFFGRIIRYIRQCVAEMKKVRYPSKEELWTYFLVVIVFVAVLMAFTGLADLGFSRLSTLVFA